jgi:hypothetical protein
MACSLHQARGVIRPAGGIQPRDTVSVMQDRPGSVIQNRPSEHGALGPYEWPVPGHGENHSGYLDDASIKEVWCGRAVGNHSGFFA